MFYFLQSVENHPAEDKENEREGQSANQKWHHWIDPTAGLL